MVAVIVARLFCIQIIDHDIWTEKAAAQQTKQNVLIAKRGEVYMMDGDTPVAVAMNATVYTVIVDPMLASQEEVEKIISPLIGDKRVAEWKDIFADKKLRYYVVARNVERKAAEKVAEADLAGVWLQANTKRVYPEGDLGATVLGFVNAEYNSAAGLVKSSWKYEGNKWIWNFTVPEGAVALVTLPGEDIAHEYVAGSYQIEK